jgi:hypothetical protein
VNEGFVRKYGSFVYSDEDDEDTNSGPPSQVDEGIVRRRGWFVDADEDDEDTASDPPSQVNEGVVWKYGGFIDSDEDDDCEYRALLLGERSDISVRGEGKTSVIHYIFTHFFHFSYSWLSRLEGPPP